MITSIIEDGVRGRSMLYLGYSSDEVIKDIADELTLEPKLVRHIRRTNGMQRIDFMSGGRVDFARPATVRDFVRGRSYDMVYVDSRNDDINANDFRQDLMPCFTSREEWHIFG